MPKTKTFTLSSLPAQYVVDFVDAGVCSTLMHPKEYREQVLPTMLGLLAKFQPDCVVAEIGASPCEPYNGIEVLKALLVAPDSCPASRVFIVLCASDAYAVSGLCHALNSEGLDFHPDIVCGIAVNNSAGCHLVTHLSGLFALDISDHTKDEELRKLLKKRLLDP